MSSENLAGESRDLILEADVDQALSHFKASVDAWSNAAYSRPVVVAAPARRSWRLAAGWALGCALAAGSLAGIAYERQQRQEQVRVAAMKAAAQKTAQERTPVQQAVLPVVTPQRQAVAVKPAMDSARAKDEDLLASVDSDISRQVPAAMQPLADLMDSDGPQ